MAGIQLSGLASGLDTASIIDALMNVERQPRVKLTQKQTQVQAREDALNTISDKLTDLRLATRDLRSIATWVDTQSVTSSDETKVVATRTGGAGPGGYDVSVTRLASATQRTFTYASPASATTLTINGKDADGNALTTSVSLAAGATIDDAVAQINGADNSSVYAVNVSGKLVLSSRQTGDLGQFTYDDGGSGTLTMTSERLGQKAQVTVDGTQYESDTNTVKNAIAGVDLKLKGLTSSNVQIEVGSPGPDRDGLKTKLKAFVDAYNDVVTTIRAKTTEKSVKDASTDADLAKGVLFGDTGLNGILSQLRTGISNPIAGAAATLNELAEIGISTGDASGSISQDAVAGKLTLDTKKLDAALDDDPYAVRKLLGGVVGTDGFAQRLEGVLNPYTQTGGVMELRISSAKSEYDDLTKSIASMDDRLAAKQDQLQKQYTALETALQNLQGQQSSLSSYLG
jgi:flagellar hook-associated protein 2